MDEQVTGGQLIVLKQLPIIEQQLQAVRGRVLESVQIALSMPVTEETYKDVKRMRADLSREYKELEARRKEIKKQILAPYEEFDKLYKETVGNLYTDADRKLAGRIDVVTTGLKKEKEDEVIEYFEELRTSLSIPEDMVHWEDLGISINLSDSKKSLKGKVEEILTRIRAEIDMIAALPEKDEILVEYVRYRFDVTRAVKEVKDRHDRIEAERKRREQMEFERAAAAAVAEKVAQAIAEDPVEPETKEEPLAAPNAMANPEADVEASEKVFETSFRVRGTIDELKALKMFLENGGYDYEQL